MYFLYLNLCLLILQVGSAIDRSRALIIGYPCASRFIFSLFVCYMQIILQINDLIFEIGSHDVLVCVNVY